MRTRFIFPHMVSTDVSTEQLRCFLYHFCLFLFYLFLLLLLFFFPFFFCILKFVFCMFNFLFCIKTKQSLDVKFKSQKHSCKNISKGTAP